MLTNFLPSFEEAEIGALLSHLNADQLDRLQFGVIGFDVETKVQAYNTYESRAAGLRPAGVLGNPLFEVVAPCMNNFMVAQRFVDAAASGDDLDAVVDYVLTLRMRPVKVQLRLVAQAGALLRYVLVQRGL